ncbi:Kelch repeat-containing protein [Halococcus saccharolyticus]|uniref:Kelch repeat-containing protein n=1 Tax=Halococcus saccharolyticus DSM 5350 TaxID=1227455 RepID=M0MQI9_9EURY|nr:kelch repeat-containing protein [Halococcus saccharolyticus]EMA47987.1 Kelch repeat-containing protein [Halococcus saccharolyticus DSM 5350]
MNVNGTIYSFGGIRDDTDLDSHYDRATADTYAYDTANDSWSSGPDLPKALWGQAGVVANGTCYLFGGAETDVFGSGNIEDSIYTFTPGSGWSTLGATCPEPVYAVRGALGPDGLIYIAGGATGAEAQTDTDRIWRFDPSSNSVESSEWATLPQPVRWSSVAMANVDGTDYLYHFGGHNVSSGNIVPTTTRYPLSGPNEGQPESMADAPMAFRQALSDTVINGKVYIAYGHVGSIGTNDDFKPNVFRYDVETDSWDEEMPQIPSNRARIVGASGVVDGTIYVAGGHIKNYDTDAHDTKAYVDTFDPDKQVTVGGGTGPTETLPSTNPDATPEERASQAGFDIQNTVTASSTGDIGGASNTLYVVEGELSWDGQINIGNASDVAICGTGDASVPIPAGYRDYAVTVSGGSGFMWSGIDMDQTASGAWGRLNVNTSDRGFLEYFQTLGSGRRANPDPSASLGAKSGPMISMPATSSGGANRIKNVGSVHAGVMANDHEGDRPIGVFLADDHEGTLNIVDSVFDSFPNNGLYATNTSGSVVATGTTFRNNGVSNGRIAHGRFENCTAAFDYENTELTNADAGAHGVQGFAVEDKGKGSGVTITGCTVELANVAKCGGGIDVRSGVLHAIKNTEVHMGNVGGAPDIIVDGRCEQIQSTALSGSASSGTAVINNGPQMAVADVSIDYPSGRSDYSGPINRA